MKDETFVAVLFDREFAVSRRILNAPRTVIQFKFTDQPEVKRLRWVIGDTDSVELCITNPGFEFDLFVETDSRTVTLVWYGDLPPFTGGRHDRASRTAPAV